MAKDSSIVQGAVTDVVIKPTWGTLDGASGTAGAIDVAQIISGILLLLGDSFCTKDELNTALSSKQDALTFDAAPTSESNNPVRSGGVYAALSGKSDVNHTHDGRYYTESETDILLSAKVNTADLGDLAVKDKVDWDTDIDDIPQSFPPSSHNHDDRYYTESETDTALANCLPLSGGTMTGTIRLHTTDGLEFPNEAGFTTDQYGNFKHKRDTASDSWGLMNNAGTSQFTVQWESGTVTKGIWNGTAIDLSHGGTGGNSLAAALANLLFTVAETSTSINSLTTPGIYYVSGNTGIPEGSNGILIVIAIHRGSSVDAYKQIYIRYGTSGSNDGNIYHRRISSSNGANVKWWKLTGTLVS